VIETLSAKPSCENFLWEKHVPVNVDVDACLQRFKYIFDIKYLHNAWLADDVSLCDVE
jgi:hypothetical protein